MLSNRKIKKMIKKELASPPNTDEFCEACGFEFVEVPQSAPKIRRWIPTVTMSAAAVAVVCGCIPLMLPNKGGNTIPDVKYGETDVYRTDVSEAEFLTLHDIVLFNMDYMDNYSAIQKVVTVENKAELGYEIKRIEYNFTYDGELFAYDFDFLMYSSDRFDFHNKDRYSDLSTVTEIKGTAFRYKTIYNKDGKYALIYFESGEYDYYISLSGYEDLTEIDDESIATFLKKAFGEE